MKVHELVASLGALDPNAEVLYWNGDVFKVFNADQLQRELVCTTPARDQYWAADEAEDRRREKLQAVVLDVFNALQ